jgi:hypothetical protein
MAKGPSALDLEVRSLGPEGGGSIPLLLQFITMLHTGLNARRYFEAVQAYLGLFLKVLDGLSYCTFIYIKKFGSRIF